MGAPLPFFLTTETKWMDNVALKGMVRDRLGFRAIRALVQVLSEKRNDMLHVFCGA